MNTALDLRSAQLMDAERIGPVLHAALPGCKGTRLLDAQVHQSRRRLSRKSEEGRAPFLELAYALNVCAPGSTTPHTQWCSVQAWAQATGWEAASTGHRLPVLGAVLQPLQRDPDLPQLTRFLDAQAVQHTLARNGLGGQGPVHLTAAPEVRRYEPRSHVVARYETQRLGQRRAIWGKAYAGETWRDVARLLLLLWPHGQSTPGAFVLARPAATSQDLRAVWQDELPGQPLREQLHGPQALQRLSQLGPALAHLQNLRPLGQNLLSPPSLLARALKQAGKLQRAQPAWQSLLQPLTTALAHAAPATPRLVNVHGDFHVDQMTVADDRLQLFDLDNFALGHPVHDIADFASQLLTDDGFEPAQRLALARHAVQAATDTASWPVDAAALDWHLRVLLLRKAYSFFVRHRPGWPQRAQHALQLATLGSGALQSEPLGAAA